jgi:SAM-dependent methyltransferase
VSHLVPGELNPEKYKRGQRRVWSSGDYPLMATRIEAVAVLAVERCGVAAGERVLDVATGSGNAALAAAARGAQVIGLDLTPELLLVARERAAAAGRAIEFVEGDAEALPFADASFDRVTSVFGAIFAPDHARAAGELLRVCRPGGTIAVTGWTPASLNGQMTELMAEFLPPPAGAASPMQWGEPRHVRELFAAAAEVDCSPERITFQDESVERYLAEQEAGLGPLIALRRALEPKGRWPAARAALLALYERANRAGDGRMVLDGEYLLTLVRP